MFRELVFIATILGVASLGTEIVFRFRPDSLTGEKYINQSNAVLACTAVEVLSSVYITRVIETVSPKKMKIITVIVIAALITAITFRSMYGFFLPLGNSQLNLYNATSFFICLTTIVWSVFWFFKKEEPLIDTVPIVLDERNYRERRRPTNSRVNRSDADDHYHIDGEALPSYYELPAPPLYVKVPPEFSVPQEAHSSSRPSYQNNTTIIDIIPHPNTSSNSTNQNQSNLNPLCII